MSTAAPTRTVLVTATAINIRKTPAYPGDPFSLPVSYSTLRFASGGETLQLVVNPFQSGTLTFVTNPVAAETIAVNGVTFTFVAGDSTATNVHIGSSKEETAANFAVVLNQSVNASIVVARYAVALTGGQPNANVVTIIYKTPGTTSYTLANSSGTAAVTRSGATLTGGGAYGTGQEVTPDADFNDIDQSLARYVVASGAGPTTLYVTDYFS